MRILQVTPYYENAWAYGGIPRVVAALSHGLARRGHQVTVCTTDVRDERSRLEGEERGGGSPDVRVFPNLSNRLAYHLQLFLPRGLDRFPLTVTGGNIDVDTGVIIQGPPIGTNTTGQEAEGPHCVGGGE